MSAVCTATTGAGRYTGPGLYEITDGSRVYIDPIPEEMVEYFGDMLVWSETAEERARPGRNQGMYWGLRDIVEAVIVRKVEGGER
jgi:hypothetical protein